MAEEAMDICLQVLKESNKSYRFDSYSVRNSVLLLSHITFRDCRVLIFSDNFLEIAVNNTRPDYVFFDSLCEMANAWNFIFWITLWWLTHYTNYRGQ